MSENTNSNSKNLDLIKSDINICISIINFMVSELETSLANEKTDLKIDEIQSKNFLIIILFLSEKITFAFVYYNESRMHINFSNFRNFR